MFHCQNKSSDMNLILFWGKSLVFGNHTLHFTTDFTYQSSASFQPWFKIIHQLLHFIFYKCNGILYSLNFCFANALNKRQQCANRYGVSGFNSKCKPLKLGLTLQHKSHNWIFLPSQSASLRYLRYIGLQVEPETLIFNKWDPLMFAKCLACVVMYALFPF